MIEASFFEENGNNTGFSIKGHSGAYDSGEDIICASVSSAIQFSANLITESFKIKADVKVYENKIDFNLIENDINGIKILDGLVLHLEILSEDYPGTIKIIKNVKV